MEPHYQRIAAWIREYISDKAEGSPVPSEVKLARQFSVSRMTARSAIRIVESEGLVVRARGAGTFVAPRALHGRRGPIVGFHADFSARGLTPKIELLFAGLRNATSEEQISLHVSRVVGIRRLRLVDEVPIAIENGALIPALSPVLEFDLQTSSLYSLLHDLDNAPTTAEVRILSRLAVDDEAELLKIEANSPVLVEKRVTHSADGRAIEATTAVYAAARYTIDAEFAVKVV